MSDEEIIDACLEMAASIPSTAGSLADRFTNKQKAIAHDIYNKTFTDIEHWVRTGEPAKYD